MPARVLIQLFPGSEFVLAEMDDMEEDQVFLEGIIWKEQGR